MSRSPSPSTSKITDDRDPVADQNVRLDFVQRYDIKHEIVEGRDGSRVLVVGTEGWPFPVPLVKSGSKWQFDTANGIEEIINRRIGRNELTTIQTCLAIGDAQREYYRRDRDGDGILEYAQKVASTVNRRDGLFWAVGDNEPPSPLGELIAAAAAEGYTMESPSYNGYHYRLLRSQGPSAPGGAYDYMARDNQIGGFAVLAFPAIYGDSGIMTFMVSHAGIDKAPRLLVTDDQPVPVVDEGEEILELHAAIDAAHHQGFKEPVGGGVAHAAAGSARWACAILPDQR